ncbi:MAG: thiamine phosphate synthase [Deltaproteobacteria bacterium]
MKGFYFVTDAGLSRRGIAADVKAAVKAGVCMVQYRNKEGSTRKMLEEASALRKICRDCLFVVNDRVDICLAAGADGAHIGQDDMPLRQARRLLGKKAVIGVTVHDLKEALEAQKKGADYLGVSPVFTTKTKSDAGKAAGIGLIREIRLRTRLPIVAIGGITLANAPSVIAAGADSLCAISAVLSAGDVHAEIVRFQRLFK